MAKKQKYYVVWKGVAPGVYKTWNEARANIHGYPGAQYKSFPTYLEALEAFEDGKNIFYKNNPTKKKDQNKEVPKFEINSISVDAACSGNPGLMEYQGVKTYNGEQIFYQGPFKEGTNNIGEFLALVHALAFLKKVGKEDITIYTDSRTAMAWVRNKKVKTTLIKTTRNEFIFELINRGEKWLKENSTKNPIVKWPTKKWGEIPADFGRK